MRGEVFLLQCLKIGMKFQILRVFEPRTHEAEIPVSNGISLTKNMVA